MPLLAFCFSVDAFDASISAPQPLLFLQIKHCLQLPLLEPINLPFAYRLGYPV